MPLIRRLRRVLITAQGIWAVMNVVSVILSFAVPTIALGTPVGPVLGGIALCGGCLGWKWGLAEAPRKDITKPAGRLLRRALLLFVTYLGLELLLPSIGVSVPIVYASPEWFWVLVTIRWLVLGASVFMFDRLFVLLHRAGAARRSSV